MAEVVKPDTANNPDLYKSWMGKITDALKREKTFRKQGVKCVDLYEAKNAETTPFAILYSNVETLQPAVYNARPIPVVDRRFKDEDPVGKLAAEAGTRILKYLIEAESVDCDNFDELMYPAVLDALVTNRGLTRYKYEADTSTGTVKGESVFGEAVRWDKFFHGYGRTWKKVPWIGFEWDMSMEEWNENFPDAKGKCVLEDSANSEEATAGDKDNLAGVKLAKVYEVWDKASKKLIFCSPSYKGGLLKVVADPLGLESFFPVPKPLNFMRKVTTLIPTPLYIQYEAQAKEINAVTVRLRKIIEALKVRGFYNSTIEGIDKLLTADDNTMIPVENMESMPDGQGVDKVLWLMPLAELSTVAQNLYTQREQIKSVIYEITGISDILRGASVASETATAQNIKNQWGTLRLKKMQKEVMRYCRDSMRIMLEIAVTKFSEETISAMTGLPYPTGMQKQQAGQQVQMIQQHAAMQAQMLAQQPPQMDPQTGQPVPPQPPQPPQIPPQLQQIMEMPAWDEIIALLKDDTSRNYRVDIETNSTIDAEASQDKQDISELLNALSQFLNGIGPLIQQGVMPFEVAKIMMLAIARRFTFGSQLEDQLNKMAAPPPPPDANAPNPADEAKLQGIQAQAQADAAAAQQAIQQTQMDGQIAQMEFEQKKELMQLEMQAKREELMLKNQELQIAQRSAGMKLEVMTKQHSQKLQMISAKANEKEPTNASQP